MFGFDGWLQCGGTKFRLCAAEFDETFVVFDLQYSSLLQRLCSGSISPQIWPEPGLLIFPLTLFFSVFFCYYYFFFPSMK